MPPAPGPGYFICGGPRITYRKNELFIDWLERLDALVVPHPLFFLLAYSSPFCYCLFA